MAAQSISSTTINPTRISHPEYTLLSQTRTRFRPNNLHSSWLGSIAKLSIDTSTLRPFYPKYPPVKATITFSLPTANPERVALAEKIPKWSSKAIKSFAMGELEARKIKFKSFGTEALILGILIEGTNFASKFLRVNGITLMKVREECVNRRGKVDIFYFSPEHPPLGEDAQNALDWAFDEKLKSGTDGEITTSHLLLGVWSQEESPGHKILASFGLNNEKVKEIVSSISKPGIAEY